MNANNYVRAPTLKLLGAETNASFVEKFPRLRTHAINNPIQILHPVLAVSQQPVVQTNQPRGD
jgi:hypothetical protein